MKPVAILYEHPAWFGPLFAELERRGVPYEPLHVSGLRFDPASPESPYSLVVNRMSPSAWTRGHADAIFHTLDYLEYLDEIGAPLLNGARAYAFELSKARQAALISRLGLAYPRTRVIHRPEQALDAARELDFPVLAKPNIGGSGAGIRSFDSLDELEAAGDQLELGIDGIGLVQERLPAAGGHVVRIEILGGELLYAIKLRLAEGSFNLCPADYCELPGIRDGVSGRGLPIEAYDAPQEIVDGAKRIVAAAGMDLGGVEYLVNERDGRPYYYDVNALSNFVADAPNVVGFDPFVDLVDLILERARAAELVTGSAGPANPDRWDRTSASRTPYSSPTYSR